MWAAVLFCFPCGQTPLGSYYPNDDSCIPLQCTRCSKHRSVPTGSLLITYTSCLPSQDDHMVMQWIAMNSPPCEFGLPTYFSSQCFSLCFCLSCLLIAHELRQSQPGPHWASIFTTTTVKTEQKNKPIQTKVKYSDLSLDFLQLIVSSSSSEMESNGCKVIPCSKYVPSNSSYLLLFQKRDINCSMRYMEV